VLPLSPPFLRRRRRHVAPPPPPRRAAVAAAAAALRRRFLCPLLRRCSRTLAPLPANNSKQVCVCPGDTVLDVGANIGLFTCWAAEAAGPSGRVVALEPVPAVAAAAAGNTSRHAAWHGAAAPVTLLAAAAGDGGTRALTITVYPRALGWSTCAPDAAGVAADMAAFLDNFVDAPASGLPPLLAVAVRLGAALKAWPLTRPLYAAAARAYTRHMLEGAATVECPCLTVSDVIDGQGLDRVDLLKVDVERGEAAVLKGISDRHWPLVRQVAAEVHAPAKAGIEAALRSRGFEVAFSQTGDLRGTSIYNCYAKRTGI
jgi:FkbM family methyltransferase